MRNLFVFIIFCISHSLYAQYTMTNNTVYDCQGTLTDSEANSVNPGWYDHNEDFFFTICPNGALSITISFDFFETEPVNDYIIIYDGPDNTYPIIGGPYSGMNLPPQLVSSGCVTIRFISDVNVAAEGFELNWVSDITPPAPPVISLPTAVNCSADVVTIQLDQNMHCDSVYTAQVSILGQVNQIINAMPISCINDSTDIIQLNLSPGLNESGIYSLNFQYTFKDDCDSIWDLSAPYQLVINDCPLQVNLTVDNDSICLGDCAELLANVEGGDSTSYSYVWSPIWMNSPGIHTVCPVTTTQYIVTVDDLGPATAQSDTITITVLPPPNVQAPISICQTDPPINLVANPNGGSWSGNGISSSANGTFDANNLVPGIYTVSYGFGGCSDEVDITVLEINAGPDIAACINAPLFNLNSIYTTAGGVWSGCNCIQANGDISVGANPDTINAIYTLPNGCSDSLSIFIGTITTQNDDTICQQSGNYNLTFSPINGTWSVLEDNPQISSSCQNYIDSFPFYDGFELGLASWTQDPANDFDWIVNNGSTSSGGTGPNNSFEGLSYVYTEASNPNFPYKQASIISPCLNLSAYNNPVLNFWYHMYDGNSNNGINQGFFSIDVSLDNGINWINDIWQVSGNQGNQWLEASINLGSYNSAELLVRLRVITGDLWQSDVAVDHLSILAGPVTIDGVFLSSVADSGMHNLIYSVNGCNDYTNLYVKPIDAGLDMVVCPSQVPFNLIGMPNGGFWSGTHITNIMTGLFDPSLGLGINLVTYTFDGCIDTIDVNVVDTDVQIDSLFFCINEGVKELDIGLVPRTPWNGNWTGNGIISLGYPGEFSPIIAGVGIHNITYEANTCVDNLLITVHPESILSDTLICSSSPDFILNVTPAGGVWVGNGILDNNTGLFSPSQLGIGIHQVGYVAPSGCIDTFTINIYDPPTLTLVGLETDYCFKDTNIQVIVSPAGGVLSGNGVNGLVFNPSLAGEGYHNIVYSYGSGICLQTIDMVVFVSEELVTSTYYTYDTICIGDIVTIGIQANGGSTNYTFSWNNSLSSSFEHMVEPTLTTTYIVSVDDGCSTPTSDSILIFVHPEFDLTFSTSIKRCYGAEGFAHVIASPLGSYNYQWNTNPIVDNDSLFAPVNKSYQVEVTDNNTNCSIKDTVTIPGFSELRASFFPSNTECVSILDATFQFNDNSLVDVNELSANSYWDFGDGATTPYVFTENPIHQYADTGSFLVQLYLENINGCKDSTNRLVCIMPEMEIHAPNSFTPNGDNCNDQFYIKGAGGFYYFNIKIHQRWGGDIIFESNEVVLTNDLLEGNICNQMVYDNYFKMGSWDGIMNNGAQAPQGVYPYIVDYQYTNGSSMGSFSGFIVLIR